MKEGNFVATEVKYARDRYFKERELNCNATMLMYAYFCKAKGSLCTGTLSCCVSLGGLPAECRRSLSQFFLCLSFNPILALGSCSWRLELYPIPTPTSLPTPKTQVGFKFRVNFLKFLWRYLLGFWDLPLPTDNFWCYMLFNFLLEKVEFSWGRKIASGNPPPHTHTQMSLPCKVHISCYLVKFIWMLS